MTCHFIRDMIENDKYCGILFTKEKYQYKLKNKNQKQNKLPLPKITTPETLFFNLFNSLLFNDYSNQKINTLGRGNRPGFHGRLKYMYIIIVEM